MSLLQKPNRWHWPLTGTRPVPPQRDRRGQGAQYKMILPRREAAPCGPGASKGSTPDTVFFLIKYRPDLIYFLHRFSRLKLL
jgi:hypothetical protein